LDGKRLAHQALPVRRVKIDPDKVKRFEQGYRWRWEMGQAPADVEMMFRFVKLVFIVLLTFKAQVVE
jgi:hypothetical protein